MSLASSVAAEITLLQQSAAFAMSLGAKELFHTNFLAFLLETEDVALNQMRLAIRNALNFSPEPRAVSQCVVWRERDNLDLVIVELMPAPIVEQNADDAIGNSLGDWDWSKSGGWQHKLLGDLVDAPVVESTGSNTVLVPTGRVLIIEAKLKSVARLEQLEIYDQRLRQYPLVLKFPKDESTSQRWEINLGCGNQETVLHRVLLSVAGKPMTTSICTWQGVAWSAVQQSMQAELLALGDHSLAHTLNDYVGSLGALIRMTQSTHLMLKQSRGPAANVPYGAFFTQPVAPIFKALRVTDLLGKTLFDAWLAFIRPTLHQECPPEPNQWRLRDYVIYTRGTPGFGFEFIGQAQQGLGWECPSSLRIGVQLQGALMGLYCSVDHPWEGLEAWAAKHPTVWGQWFNTQVADLPPLSSALGKPLVVMPAPANRHTNLRVFNVKRFIYSARSVTGLRLSDIESEIIRLLVHLRNLLPNI